MQYNKSNIKHRLVKYVADLWGYQQADMDGFDPIIDLLLGACAVEFERTGNQIVSSQSRVLEKLAHLLLPESLTIPQPSHAVLHASAVEPRYTLTSRDQFSYDKEVINPAKPTEIGTKAVYFSPTSPVTLIDGGIRYIGMGNKLLEQVDFNVREKVAIARKGEGFPKQEVWLGVKLNSELIHIPELSFFFDWRNNPNRQKYLNLLPVTQVTVNENDLPTKSGYSRGVEDRISKLRSSLIREWDIIPKIEDQVNQVYQHHFLTIEKNQVSIKESTNSYPAAFENYFDTDALHGLQEKLVWFKLRMSQLIPQDAVEEMICTINCFPACNRQLVDNRRPYRLDKTMNIIPLKADDYFLSIHEVASGEGKPFQAVPFFNFQEMEPGTYAIRKDRVGRFDSRNAREMLNYVLELMRDEAAAFAATGGAIGSKDIIELEQNLNKIENNLAKRVAEEDIEQYLILKPGKARDVYVSFWNTAGAQANQIPAGSLFKTRSVDVKSNTVFSATTSYGGKNKPSEQEKLYTFRSNLLSRDRIVTREDIKAACYAELGNSIRHVEVRKGFSHSPSHQQGLIRVMEVILTPEQNLELSEEEWAKICNELASTLEQKASVFLPIKVRVASQSVV